MSASALLLISMLARRLVSGCPGLRARPALWRQFPAHDGPRAHEKSDADNRRRGERGEILQHERFLDLYGQSRSAKCGTGIAWRPDRLVMCPQYALYPQVQGCWSAITRGTTEQRGNPAAPVSEENVNKRSSMRVFPSVFGLTRSKSRNSATPSS
jgi:hypothetical protein